jgi:hypothetical protein
MKEFPKIAAALASLDEEALVLTGMMVSGADVNYVSLAAFKRSIADTRYAFEVLVRTRKED